MTRAKGDGEMAANNKMEKPERLGLLGNLALHSQFILIGLLVLGAVVLKVLYG